MAGTGKPLSRPALAGLVLGVSALAAVAVSGIGYRLGGWPVLTALRIAEWAAYGAALALPAGLAGLLQARPGGRRRGLPAALLGLAAALPVAAMALHWQYATRAYPPINDITTDTTDPPVFWDMPEPTAYPGEDTARQQRAAYPDLVPLVLPLPPEQAFVHALAAAREQGWEIVARVPEEGRVEAVATSFLYGFKDEVVVRVVAAEGGARVDVRSRSRLGRIDRGANARRIRAYLADLQDQADESRR